MRKPTPLPDGAKERVAELLRRTKTKSDFQRVLCVWLRAAFGFRAAQIAQMVGWSEGRVWQVHADYLRQGETALLGVGRGGPRHCNFTEVEEDAILASLLAEAGDGEVVTAGEVKAAYERRLGRRAPKSTVYRMLDRHGWRKIVPRPRHSEADPEAQEEFKKNWPPS